MEVMGEAITTPTTPHSFLLPFATCGGETLKASVCGAENLSRINLVQCPAATIGATPLSLFSVFTTLCTLSRTLHLSLRFLPSQMIDRSLSTHRLLFAFVVSLNSLVHLSQSYFRFSSSPSATYCLSLFSSPIHLTSCSLSRVVNIRTVSAYIQNMHTAPVWDKCIGTLKSFAQLLVQLFFLFFFECCYAR